MTDEQDRLMELFNAARVMGTAEEQDTYLAAACGEDIALRRQVEKLLEAHTLLGDFLDGGVIPAFEDPVGEGPGDVVGRYKLLEQIGEGGFGVVFMAEQLEPIRRRVALKIVKPGMDTRQVIARFEAERQALALMEHPNIAQVFDAGATDGGRPYFVMELVRGVPITAYCDANALPAAERLHLFLMVCGAMEHAHGKGIIHRDLKPSNVLVTLHDGKPVPKVIDFGTAKALDRPLTDKTMFTAFGRLIGTPAYMSPEQAEMSGLEVDRRADVYALGVLLYELLTGTTPFESERLKAAAFDEMMRIIRQEDPPKPSTRVSTLGERATAIAEHRRVDPQVLQRTLRGDLDWIVMKALEKDRERRYFSAASFAEDVEHHLRHQPVRARPPTMAYRLGRFYRRHRALAATAAIVVVVLAAAGLFAWQEHRKAQRLAAAAADSPQARTGRELIAGVASVERDTALSPDGTMLAYVDYNGPDWDLWVLDLEAGDRRNLTQSETYDPDTFQQCVPPAIWSPDSKQLVYGWVNQELMTSVRVIDADGSSPPRILRSETKEDYYLPEAWSHDGRRVVCRRRRPSGTALIDLDSGVIEDLPVEHRLEHPRFSANNRYLVFSRDNQVELYDLPSHRVTPLTAGTSPIWAPDAPVVLFSSDRMGSWDLWGVRVEDGRLASEPFPVRYGIGDFEKRLTASGMLLIHRRIAPGDGYTVAEGAPSPEVAALEPFPGRLVLELGGRLHTLASEGGRAVVRPMGTEGQPSSVLHAGRRWFLRGHVLPAPNPPPDEPGPEFVELIAAALEGSVERTIRLSTATNMIACGDYRWTRDAERGLADGRISWVARHLIDPEAEETIGGIYTTQIAFDPAGNITGPLPSRTQLLLVDASNHDWAPDGTRLVYALGPKRTQELYILDLVTRQSHKLTEGSTPAWTPDGSAIAFQRDHDAIYVIRPDGSGLQTLAQWPATPGATPLEPRPGYYGLVWAPDSQALLYGRLDLDGREVFRIARSGGESQNLTRSVLEPARPIAWLAEGED